jgi:(1->4)-alpha-D-glucan 1-alpha-D-glucosylmutase
VRSGLGATYRVQLRPGFGFAEVAGVTGYLAALGIELLYLSPVAEARPGSLHGYDVTDPTALRDELGGSAGFEALVSALERHGLGLLLDFVPAYMSTWAYGPWWGDVLRYGPASRFAPVFDVDWDAGGPGERGKVALPALDRPLEDALEQGELTLVAAPDGARLRVGTLFLPVSGPVVAGDDVLDVLAAQHYRLIARQDGAARNYRRFLDVDDLVALREDDEDVFARVHTLLAGLALRGVVSAVRVDRVDSMADPGRYLRRLDDLLGGIPILVDKVLSGDEQLPDGWPVAGTTGYEAIDDLSCALVEPGGLGKLVRAAAREGERAVDEVVRAAKAEVLAARFRPELADAAAELGVELDSLRDLVLGLPTYRTYAGDAASDTLLSRVADGALAPVRRAGHRRQPFEQLTAAVATRAIERTAWSRLVGPLAFCEVGGDPRATWAGSAERLAVRATARARDGRTGLVPGTTHETRQSADVRARLLALAEMPDELEAGIVRFAQIVPVATLADGTTAPDALERRRIAQIVLAMAPPLQEGWLDLPPRVEAAVLNTARDAKLRTSLADPHPEYEAALSEAVHSVLADQGARLRLVFGDLVDEVARLGAVISLATVVLRSTLPGSPDCYQGDESWNLLLAEPHSRRPADFDAAARSLGSLTAARTGDEPASLRRSWRDGRVKMLVTRQALRARRAAPAAFGPGASAVTVPIAGTHADHALSLARVAADGSRVAIAVVTRHARALPAPRDDLPVGPTAWGDTALTLPAGAPAVYVDALTGRRHATRGGGAGRYSTRDLWLAEVLRDLPVAILVGAS